jgi:hypothetical protein
MNIGIKLTFGVAHTSTKVVRVEILRKIGEGSKDRESGDRKILPNSQINLYMHINSCICIIHILYMWKNTPKQPNHLMNKHIIL